MLFQFSVSLSVVFNQYVRINQTGYFGKMLKLTQINPIALGKLGWKYYVSLGSSFFSSLKAHGTFIDCVLLLDRLWAHLLLPVHHRDEGPYSGRNSGALWWRRSFGEDRAWCQCASRPRSARRRWEEVTQFLVAVNSLPCWSLFLFGQCRRWQRRLTRNYALKHGMSSLRIYALSSLYIYLRLECIRVLRLCNGIRCIETSEPRFIAQDKRDKCNG